MSEWKEYKLGEFIKVKHGFAFKGDYIVSDETDKILVTPGNFHIGGGFKSDKFKYYNSEEFPQDYILKDGDIVVTMTDLSKDSDTLGYSAIIPFSKNKKYLHNQRIGLVQFISDEVCHNFVYWLLRTKEYQSYIIGSASGTSIMHTSPSRIENYSCLFPPLDEQRRIAAILSSLDDKIDLLHRENATLEQMAETLFRQWFVEEAKEEWEEGKLGDICNYVNEKIDIGNVETGDYISTENMCPNKQGVVLASSVPENGKATKYRIDDVLLSNIRPYFKKIWLSDREGGCSADVLCIRGKNELYAFFSYYTIRQDEFFDYVMLGSKGCKMPRGDKSHIMNWPIIIPPKDELLKFNEIAKQGITKIRNNNKQIRTLIQMRDGLLPRLMGGEVKI